MSNRPAFRNARPAPRRAPGPPPSLTDTATWTRIVEPRERYRIVYRDRDGQLSERTIELLKVGHTSASPGHDAQHYFGVIHAGKPKTFRADRIVSVVEQLTTGHEPSLRPAPTYATELPAFPLPGAVFKVPSTAGGRRSWTVDLNAYTCTCPEKRIRLAAGYAPGQLGMVCDHMAKALLDHLSSGSGGWTPELLAFLRNPRRIHVGSLS